MFTREKSGYIKLPFALPFGAMRTKKTPWKNHGVDEGVTLGSLLFRERDVEHRIGGLGVLAIDDVDHLFDHIGVSGCDVVVFVEVFREIVKTAVAALNDQLPIAHAHTEHIGLVEFPVEGIVALLGFGVASEGGIDGDAVVEVTLVVLIGLGEVANAGHVAEGGQHVVEGKLVIGNFARLDFTGPAHDEGDTNAAFVGGAFQTFEESIAVEERGIGTAFFVRAIVGGEDHDGVFVETFLLEFGKNLADVGIQAGDHSRKLRVGDFGAVITVAKLAGELVFLAEMILVGEEEAVFGLCQFGVRERVGEDAEEGLRGALLIEPFHSLVVDEIGRILRALGVVGGGGHAVLDVFLEDNAVRLGVAGRTAEGVEEVGIVGVRFELTNVAEILVDTSLVGGGCRRLVTARPLTEHTGGVAVGLEDFGENLMIHVIGFLTGPSFFEVGVLPIEILDGLVAPILFVAAHMGVSAVLSGHEGCAGGSRHGATGIGLGEAHAFGGHAVDVGGGDILLTVATEIAVAHIVTHDIDDVGSLLGVGGEGGEGAESDEGICFLHDTWK